MIRFPHIRSHCCQFLLLIIFVYLTVIMIFHRPQNGLILGDHILFVIISENEDKVFVTIIFARVITSYSKLTRSSVYIISFLITVVVNIITMFIILVFDFFPLTSLPLQADTKPTKPAIKSSTLPRTSSQGNSLYQLIFE